MRLRQDGHDDDIIEHLMAPILAQAAAIAAATRGLRDTDGATAMNTKDKSRPVSQLFLQQVLGSVMEGLKSVLATHRDKIAALDARVAQLETQGPAVKWAGPWVATRTYADGELVQKNGLWLALASNTNVKPGQSSAWRLIVKAVDGSREKRRPPKIWLGKALRLVNASTTCNRS